MGNISCLPPEVSEHFGRPLVVRGRHHRVEAHADLLKTSVLVLAVMVLGAPLIAMIREATVAVLAIGLRAFADGTTWQGWISSLRLDPVYAGAAVRSLAGVRVDGVAVVAPFWRWPTPHVAHRVCIAELVSAGAIVSMVAEPGSNILARATASFGADVIWLSAGLGFSRSVPPNNRLAIRSHSAAGGDRARSPDAGSAWCA